MNKTIMPNMLYKLLSEGFNFETGHAKLMMKPQFPINSEWQTYNVYVSYRLRGAISREVNYGKSVLNMGDRYLDTQFSCENHCKEFNKNPFRVLEFQPSGKSDIPLHLVLGLVNESNKHVDSVNISGVKMRTYTNNILPPFLFERYTIFRNVLTLEEAGFEHDVLTP